MARSLMGPLSAVYVLLYWFRYHADRLGIASCWALAWRQGEISARQPEEEGQISSFPTQDVQAL